MLAAAPAVFAQQTEEPVRAPGERLRAARSFTSILQESALRRPDPSAPLGFRIALPELRQTVPPPAADKTRLQVGVHRDLTDERARGIDGTALEWASVEDGGYTTTFAVASMGAQALQLALRVDALPHRAEVRFFSPTDPSEAHGPFSTDLLVRSAESRARADGSELFWSPVINGAELAVEIYLPRAAAAGELRLTLAKVAHLTQRIESRDLNQLGNSGTCNRNIACDKKWALAAASVAKIVFQGGGGTALCTGQLLTDSDESTQRPWFLTAAHCMTKQSETSSAVFYWGFQYANCKAAGLPPVVQTAGGAKLRFTTKANGRSNDHTLMELNQFPPEGTTLGGWSAADPTTFLRGAGRVRRGERVQGIHHPSGDAKKSSRGDVLTMDGVSFSDGFGIEGDSHFRVQWRKNKGVTEGGSSGSAIWAGKRWPNQFVIGTLTGGFASCADPTAPDWYGSFGRTYEEFGKFRKLIDPASNRQ